MKWQRVNGFLAVQREQVSETLGKDWIFCVSRGAERVSITMAWEADVLPLHHSREKHDWYRFARVFDIFTHCKLHHQIAHF